MRCWWWLCACNKCEAISVSKSGGGGRPTEFGFGIPTVGMTVQPDAGYVLGHSDRELQRLTRQGR
jgi:hypothetical protein